MEPNFNGHRMVYCRLISEFALSQSRQVILATSSETIDSTEYETHMKHLSHKISIHDLGPLMPKPSWRYQRKLLRNIDRIVAGDHFAQIIVLEGDKFILPLAAHTTSHRKALTVLVMRAPLKARVSGFNNLLKRFGIAVSQRRGVDIKVLAPALKAIHPYRYRGYNAVPDPVDISSTPESIERYRADMNLDMSRLWVGVFGNITPRKNLDLVADAIGKCHSLQYGLLIAGKITQEERSRCDPSLQRLRDSGTAVIFDSRLLSDSELDSAIASVQVVAIAHSSEGPSGILGKAAASGVPVAAAGAVSLREDIERLGAGTWAPLDVDAFADALHGAATSTRKENAGLADGRDFASALLSVTPGKQ
ncbi:glycosyltransferase [Arthrobacter sp. NPDC058288]|uniref:glycosyltransferase n=1 Tax=Arthrobacter sp. NPDC058288 TaxID=3346424 RepID=UPI0036E233C6